MSTRSGRQGEKVVEQLIRYEGGVIVERQALVHGHALDFLVKHPRYGESLWEVKVWADPKKVGTDTVKKALADAYDLRAAGETRPYILVLSHQLVGLYRDMIVRAVEAGAISDVRVLGFLPLAQALGDS